MKVVRSEPSTEGFGPDAVRMPLNEAAAVLGLAPNSVRTRFKAGKLRGERDNSGKIWVWVDAKTPRKERGPKALQKPSAEGETEALRAHVQTLSHELAGARAELETLRPRASEADRLEAEMAGLKAVHKGLSDEVADLRARLDLEGQERRQLLARLTAARPWWRRLLG